MDSGNDSAMFRGIVGDSCSQHGAHVVDGSSEGVQPPTHLAAIPRAASNCLTIFPIIFWLPHAAV